MPLDPPLEQLLNQLGRRAPAPTMEEERSWSRARSVLYRPRAPLEMASVEEISVPGPAGAVPARVYRPSEQAPLPTIVQFHGGAFMTGDLDTHDGHSRLMAQQINAVVVSVDYRLAPESPFPAGYDDSLAATLWVIDNIEDFGEDPSRVALAGDSSGGNFAAGIAVACRNRGIPIAAQLLLYPVLDKVVRWPSRDALGEGYLINTKGKPLINPLYLSDESLASDPRVSPARANLDGLAPTVIGIGEFDPLRDEAIFYAKALERAGVPVILRDFPGLIHGFFGMGALSETVAAANAQLCADLRSFLGG